MAKKKTVQAKPEVVVSVVTSLLDHCNRINNLERSIEKIVQSFNEGAFNTAKGMREIASRIEEQDRKIADLEKLLIKEDAGDLEELDTDVSN